MSTVGASIESGIQSLELPLARAATWLLDLVFPPSCANCGRLDFSFCAGCRGELERAPVVVSRRRVDVLDEVWATGRHGDVLRMAVQAFKYQGVRELTEPLAHRLIKALRAANWPLDALVPVPLFADREAERGYNQSALLSQIVELETGICSRDDLLLRARDTSQQALLSQDERLQNVKGAFEATANVRGLSILLIDDVITSGSTLRECAIALRAQGRNRFMASPSATHNDPGLSSGG